MDPLGELEGLAVTALSLPFDQEDTIDGDTVERWQCLFGYSSGEAEKQIVQERRDLSTLVPQALWDTVKEKQGILGHDRASYSHWLQRATKPRVQPGDTTQQAKGNDDNEYLFKLEGPIDSVERLGQVLALTELPPTFSGQSNKDEGTAEFCRIDVRTKVALVAWIIKESPEFRPLLISQSCARREFSKISRAPMLGIECTLPQHRFTEKSVIHRPAQNEYPVHYFFYGTLADAGTLQRLLGHLDGHDFQYELTSAYVEGGALRSWGRRYKALVDGPPTSRVDGAAFLVVSKEHEDALRLYETKAYEVVRCRTVLRLS